MPRPVRPIRAWKLTETVPAPQGNAALVDAVIEQHLVKALGAVPLLLPIIERLGLRELVNRRCQPVGSGADLDLGLVTVALVCNRLLAPHPLVHVEEWLAQTALPELLGFAAAQVNDDRLARALDALGPHLDALWQDVLVRAITAFDLDLSQLCYDLTSVSFCGAYDDADLITYGYSRDHRPDRKQLELASTLTAADGVPLDYRVLAGNVADATTPVENLRRLQRLLALLPVGGPRRPAPLVISDRAMLTQESLAAYESSGWRYLGPLDPGVGHGAVRELLASVTTEELAASPLGYRPQRAAGAADWEPYQGVPRPLLLRHPDPARPPLAVRALVVWSPGKARLDAGLRQTQLGRLETALAGLAAKVGRGRYRAKASVERRVAALLAHQPARPLLTIRVEEAPTLRLVWTRDEAALANAAVLDGRYVLGTNDRRLDPEQMLASSKLRDVPEKRFALVKGPLAIRPVYLHQEARIRALVFCTMVALLVFALLELLAQRAQLGVSGQVLLAQFAGLAVLVLVLRDGTAWRQATGLAPPLVGVLHTLGFPSAEHYTTAGA